MTDVSLLDELNRDIWQPLCRTYRADDGGRVTAEIFDRAEQSTMDGRTPM